MATYPLPTLSASVTTAGISAPSFADVLASLQATYQNIFGSDVSLDPSTQDGQWIAAIAQAISDCNAAAIAVYNAFSPATAQGAGLSSVVKINGLQRETGVNSTADLTITGTVGTVITNGVVSDGTYQWALPASVTIPSGGSVVATATCTTAGNITAAAGSITKIVTPTLGWLSVTNVAAATVGTAQETDAALRVRQGKSTSLPAQTPLKAIVAAVANVTGVTRLAAYENDTGAADGNGVPAHSISLVVEGGDAVQIATAIASKKIPGGGTYGTTSEVITDPAGVPNTINFFRPSEQRIVVSLSIKALSGYVSTTATAIQNALSAYVTALPIGGEVDINGLVAAATIPGLISTYKIVVGGMQAAIYPASPTAADIALAFNAAAQLAASDVTITVS